MLHTPGTGRGGRLPLAGRGVAHSVCSVVSHNAIGGSGRTGQQGFDNPASSGNGAADQLCTVRFHCRARIPQRRLGGGAHRALLAPYRIILTTGPSWVSISSQRLSRQLSDRAGRCSSSGRDTGSRRSPRRGGSRGRQENHTFGRRLGCAVGCHRHVLVVRHPPVQQPDGARWGQCVRRYRVVLPGRPGLYRTLDLSLAPDTGPQCCLEAYRGHWPPSA